MDNESGRAWWSAFRFRRAARTGADFGDHGTAFGLDASLDRPHEPSSRLTGIPAASDFAPPSDIAPECAD